VECASDSGEHFGLDRLRAVLLEHRARPAGEILEAVLAAPRAFGAAETFPDDLTVMVVRRGSGPPGSQAVT
jgi:serine phosphatase RsbU (regulator of sigma subunit)